MTDFQDYLKYERPGTRMYGRICVNPSSESNIEYVELRLTGDIFYVAGRDISLVSLLSGANMHSRCYCSQLNLQTLEGKELKFPIGSEGRKVGDVVLKNDELLQIGRFEDRLYSEGELVRV